MAWRIRPQAGAPDVSKRLWSVRRSVCRLLSRQVGREFAVRMRAGRPSAKAGGGFLAKGRGELDQGREQAGLRHAIAVDAVKTRFRPGLVQIAEGHLLLLVIRHRLASGTSAR